jgi:signal transduction histidine kinase
MSSVVALLRRATGAARVEWWEHTARGLELVAASGDSRGCRRSVPLERDGELLVFGGSVDPQLTATLAPLGSILRRRRSEERLAQAAVELARRNEALEDFAALVAHELKTPLHAALVADDAAAFVEEALDLVESLLSAAQGEASDAESASPVECLAQAVEGLGPHGVEITSDLCAALPIAPEALRVILGNVVANAIAAGARHVHVACARSADGWQLDVDDDGVGLDAPDGYASGSGLGLALCRRIAGRAGGRLELTPRRFGGTRATLFLGEATR